MLAALSVSGSQQLRLLRTHPRVANKFQHNTTVLAKFFSRMLGAKHFRRSTVR